jgi:hypothetical protein
MRFFVLIIFYFFSLAVFAQQDSLLPKKLVETINPKKIDSSISNLSLKKTKLNFNNTSSTVNNLSPLPQNIIDSLKQLITIDSSISTQQKDSMILAKRISNNYMLLQTNPILKNSNTEYQLTNFRNYNSKDFLFYLLLFVAFILAFVQVLFPKYLKNTFDIFFQPSFRQRQTRDQLSQEYFGALLLNILFIISTSVFITLISTQQIQTNKQFWQFLLITFITLSVIYTCKYSFTKFVGWVFQQQEVAESYNFLVFLINKIIGVVLAPLIFIISYSTAELKQFSLTVAFIIIGLLLIYRFFKTVNTLRRLLKISGFHFFIYFCSVEILPLFILYKAIGKYIGNGI